MKIKAYASFLLLCALLWACKLYAQPKTDSIRKVLSAHKKQDSTQILLLLELANQYELVNSDSIFTIGEQTYTLAKKINYKKGISDALEVIGAGYHTKGKYDSALHYFSNAINVAKESGLTRLLPSKYNHIANTYFRMGKYADANIYYDSAISNAKDKSNLEIKAKAYSNQANVYYKNGNYTRALGLYLKGLRIQERLGHEINIASDVSNIANVYYRLGLYDKAIEYCKRAIAIHRKSGLKERLAGTLTTYAMIYGDKKQYDSSLIYLQEALALAEEMNNPYLKNILIGNIAECYLKKGNYAEASKLYKQTQELSEKLGDGEGVAIAKAGLGDVSLKQNDNAGGRKYLSEALIAFEQLDIKEQAMVTAAKLSENFEQNGDYQNSLKFLRVRNKLSDSLNKEKTGKEVEQLLFDYEIQKKESQIALLEKTNAVKESKNQSQRILLIVFFSGILLMAAIVYLFYFNIKNVRRSRALIVQQKEELEAQAQKLTELNNFKDATLSLLAHDLRSPVNALASTMMLLDENVINPEEFALYKQELNNKLQSVSILLDNMLYWAKDQMKGEFRLDIERLNIKRKVMRAISVLDDAAKQKNISLVNNVDENIWASGDRDHIDIIVRNILSNAIKFTRDNGVVVVEATTTGSTSSISITDNGVGMTTQQIEEIFNPDMHISTKGTEGEKGTGIGLQLCYDLVRKNNGDIKVISKPGEGSTFIIQLPA